MEKFEKMPTEEEMQSRKGKAEKDALPLSVALPILLITCLISVTIGYGLCDVFGVYLGEGTVLIGLPIALPIAYGMMYVVKKF
jgi:hypothetical protein